MNPLDTTVTPVCANRTRPASQSNQRILSPTLNQNHALTSRRRSSDVLVQNSQDITVNGNLSLASFQSNDTAPNDQEELEYLLENITKRARLDPKGALHQLKTTLALVDFNLQDKYSHFPQNPSQWLEKEEVTLKNEDLIGPRWVIKWSKWIMPIVVKDTTQPQESEQSFRNGFELLQSIDHVKNLLLYPFGAFKSVLDDNFSQYSTDKVEHIAKLWSKMLTYVLTGNSTRHPWFSTSVLHEFCTVAAASLPTLCARFDELISAHKDIIKIRSSFDLDNDEAEKQINSIPRLFLLRDKLAKNSEAMFKQSSLSMLLFYHISQELDENKVWWPVQLMRKGNKGDLSNEKLERAQPKKLLRRSRKSKSQSLGGTLKDDEVWFERIPNASKVPSHKKEFFDNFLEDEHDLQHKENWRDWLDVQNQ